MDISPQNIFVKAPAIVTPEQRKQKKLIFVLAGSVLATLLVLYFGFSSSNQAPTETPGAPSPIAAEVSFSGQGQASFEQRASAVENLTLDFSIFNDEKFQSLKLFGSSLDISGAKGRSNPFQPY